MKYTLLTTLLYCILNSAVMASNIDSAAPDFTLKSLNGKNIRLNELKGEVILLNFWASWCGPCRQEMPELDKLHKKYQRLGFKVLGVNVEKDPTAANKLLKKNPVIFPILYDTENKVSKLYAVKGMPTTVIIDRDGKMRFLHEAYKPGYEKTYEKQIKKLIRE